MKIKRKVKNDMLNRMMIGLGLGLVKSKDLILNKEMGISTQDAMDTLSLWVGREIMKGLLDKKVLNVTDGVEKLVDGLTSTINVAEEFDFTVVDGEVKIIVQKCAICPKRIGGYDLEGNTACPVGGLLVGGLTYAMGTQPIISKNNLQTGEICHINIELPEN